MIPADGSTILWLMDVDPDERAVIERLVALAREAGAYLHIEVRKVRLS